MEKIEDTIPLDQKSREMIDIHTRGYKVYTDYWNAWNANAVYATLGNAERMNPVRHYEEYLDDPRYPDYVARKDYVLSKSDPEAIRAINELVHRFNADLERIKKENDIEAAKAFGEEAQRLIYEEQ